MHNRKIAEKPQNLGKTLKTLFSYFKEYKFKLFIVILFSVLSTVFVIVGPKILGRATNTIVDGYVEKSL